MSFSALSVELFVSSISFTLVESAAAVKSEEEAFEEDEEEVVVVEFDELN